MLIKTPMFSTSVLWVQFLAPAPDFSFVLEQTLRRNGDGLLVGILSPIWETWIEFLDSKFSPNTVPGNVGL